MDPIGQQSPLDKQNITESQYLEISYTFTFKKVAALNILAPSKFIL
jgi:hypothetical protein